MCFSEWEPLKKDNKGFIIGCLFIYLFFFLSQISGHGRSDQAKSNLDPGFKPAVSQVLWPLTEQQELKKQVGSNSFECWFDSCLSKLQKSCLFLQRQFQFLMHRRLAMSTEREQVKENRQHRKHLQRTAR